MTDCNQNDEGPAGGVFFVFEDPRMGRLVSLGGMGWRRAETVQREWDDLPDCPGSGRFFAERVDAEGEVIARKPVPAEAVAERMNQRVDLLIASARARAAARARERLEKDETAPAARQ